MLPAAKSAVLGVLAVLLIAVPACGEKARAGVDEKVAKLIEQLDADRFIDREAATAELIRLGRRASAPLAAVLEAGKLSTEAAERARRVLARIYVPEFGAVWRGLGKIRADRAGLPPARPEGRRRRPGGRRRPRPIRPRTDAQGARAGQV